LADDAPVDAILECWLRLTTEIGDLAERLVDLRLILPEKPKQALFSGGWE
jgi:hypothetical protein